MDVDEDNESAAGRPNSKKEERFQKILMSNKYSAEEAGSTHISG